jgi:3-polyprenyl-4-hydroxybenzoate decarboxylase
MRPKIVSRHALCFCHADIKGGMNMRVIVAVTGASGALYAQRLLQVLTTHERVQEVAFIMSEQGRMLFAHELGVNLSHRRP